MEMNRFGGKEELIDKTFRGHGFMIEEVQLLDFSHQTKISMAMRRKACIKLS